MHGTTHDTRPDRTTPATGLRLEVPCAGARGVVVPLEPQRCGRPDPRRRSHVDPAVARRAARSARRLHVRSVQHVTTLLL